MIDMTELSQIDRDTPPRTLSFTSTPHVGLLRDLNSFLDESPTTRIRFFGNFGDWTDLEFLTHLPSVRRLALQNSDVDSPIADLTPLRAINSLEQLTLQGISKRKCDFTPLTRFSESLELLSVGASGSAAKCLEDVLGELLFLKSLGLTTLSLNSIADLNRLRFLGVGAGAITGLDCLPNSLHHVFLNGSRIAKLHEIMALPALKSATLARLSKTNITELPLHSRVISLHIEAFNSLQSLSSVKTYTQLRFLAIKRCGFAEADISVLNSVPSLEEVYIERPSIKALRAVRKCLAPRIKIVEGPRPIPQLGKD